MDTMRQLVSDIRGMYRILSTDALINDRVIASEVINSSLLLIKRETNLRKLWATDTIFTTIPCLELEEVALSECCGYNTDQTIARSKKRIPRITEGNYQYVIQGVYSINALGGRGTALKEISLNRYMNLLKLKQVKKETYYWISDDYLYVTDPDVEQVRLAALFEGFVPSDFLYSDCKCGSNGMDIEKYCMNPLDRPFFLPGYLKKQVFELASKTLRETYFNVPQDISSEGIDGQARNSSPTQ